MQIHSVHRGMADTNRSTEADILNLDPVELWTVGAHTEDEEDQLDHEEAVITLKEVIMFPSILRHAHLRLPVDTILNITKQIRSPI